MVKWVESLDHDVTPLEWESFQERHESPNPQWHADQLYSLLSRKTALNPQMIVRGNEELAEQTGDGITVPSCVRGLVTWQQVHRDARGWNSAKRRGLNTEVNHPSRMTTLADVPRALEDWKLKRKEFEALEKTTLAESTAMAAIRMIVPKGLEEKTMTVQNTVDTEKKLIDYIKGQCFEARDN